MGPTPFEVGIPLFQVGNIALSRHRRLCARDTQIPWCIVVTLELRGRACRTRMRRTLWVPPHTTMPGISTHTLVSELWYPISLTWYGLTRAKVRSIAKWTVVPQWESNSGLLDESRERWPPHHYALYNERNFLHLLHQKSALFFF